MIWRRNAVAGALAFAVLGCGHEEDALTRASERARSGQPADAASALASFAYEQKEELVSKVQEELAALDAQLETLRTKVEASAQEARASLEADLDKLKAERAALKETLDSVASATADTWTDVRTNLDSGLTHLKQACKDLAARLS